MIRWFGIICVWLLMSSGIALAQEKIEKSQLSDATPDEIGLVAKFGDDIWQGIDANEASRWLNKLPLNSSKPSVRELNKDILLSASPAPEDITKPNDFIKLRLQLLNQAGEVNASLSLLNLMKNDELDEDFDIIKNNALFAAGKSSEACKRASYFLNKYKSEYWHENLIVCDVADKNFTRAELHVGLMSEDEKQSKTDFFYVANAVVSEQIVDFSQIKDLNQQIMNLLAFTPLNQIKNLKVDNGYFIISLANNAADGDLNKLIWSEKALAYGLIKTDELSSLFKSSEFEPQDIQDPVYWANKHKKDIRARILLYKKAEQTDIAMIKAKLLSEAIKLYKANGLYYAGARLLYPLVKKTESSDELSWFARYAIEICLVNKDAELAQTWLLLAQNKMQDDDQAFMAYALLWRQVMINQPGNIVLNTDSAIDKATDALSKLGKSSLEASLYNQNILIILDALGVKITPHDWDYIINQDTENFIKTERSPSPLLMVQLDFAEIATDKAKTAMIAAIIADSQADILSSSLFYGAKAVGALHKAELNDYAVMMASEFMSSVQ